MIKGWPSRGHEVRSQPEAARPYACTHLVGLTPIDQGIDRADASLLIEGTGGQSASLPVPTSSGLGHQRSTPESLRGFEVVVSIEARPEISLSASRQQPPFIESGDGSHLSRSRHLQHHG
jgi:hypothetical protein